MHGHLTGHPEVKVRGVFHLIGVSCFLDPVINRMAVHAIHHVPVIVGAASVVAGTTTWTQTTSFLQVCKLIPPLRVVLHVSYCCN